MSTLSPTVLPPHSTETSPTDAPDTTVLGLERWGVGLVIGNVVVILSLLLCVCIMIVCVARRQRQSHHDPEHFLLKEMEDEFVESSGSFEVSFDVIAFQELLHRGTFKTVHHATVSHPPRGMAELHVAVKRLKDEQSSLGLEELMAEVYLMKSIQDKAGTHSHVVSLIAVPSKRGPPCLLLDHMPHGTLDHFLWSLKKGPIPEWYLHETCNVIQDKPYNERVSCDLMKVTVQVADGMCFLANHGFVHRDLSTRNILVGPHLHVKIANPGMYHEGYYYIVTEREHFLHDMAPECLWEKRFSVFSDVWSFGVLLYKVVTLETNPYPGVSARDLYQHIVVNNQRPQLLSSFSNKLYFLLQRCWQVVPTKRPTFPHLLTELRQLSTDSPKHIILETSREECTPGYVSNNGQVFLHSIPSSVFQLGPTARRLSTTISLADDTVCSRRTAESTLCICSSEIDSTYTGQETDEDVEIKGPSQESHDQSCDQEGRHSSKEKLVYF